MCELFGVNTKSRIKVNSYLKTFFSHSEVHKHGWGMAMLFDNASSIEKEPTCANQSYYLHERIKNPIIANNMMAHIRLASVGRMVWANSHPFAKHDNCGRSWTMEHNGTIFDFPALDKYIDVQEGGTDSERVLFYLVDRIDERQKELQRPMTDHERFTFLEEVINELSVNNKLNLLIWDGKNMYVHTNYANTLYMLRQSDETVLFSTKPLTEEDWQPVPFLRLLVFHEGRLVFEGEKRSTEYFDPEENYEYNNYNEYEYAAL